MHYKDLFDTLCGKIDILLYINTFSIGKDDEEHPNN